MAPSGRTKIVVACYWPLGGIRTYLKYLYMRIPMDEFEVAIVAAPTHERNALEADFAGTGVRLVWAPIFRGKPLLGWAVLQELRRNHADILHSQGYISAVHGAIPRRLFRPRHILTIHGIMEPRYITGRHARLKRLFFGSSLRTVDIFHGVGREILEDFRTKMPGLDSGNRRFVAIENGIDTARFLEDFPQARATLRDAHGLAPGCLVFGFFGRFMPQKGFDVIIRACRRIGPTLAGQPYVVLAVGSGDYEREYRKMVTDSALDGQLRFLPFTPDIRPYIQGCDAVLMPSNWEAYPLQPAEVFCSGIPLVCSTCIGLREAAADTPALLIEPQDDQALAEHMARIARDETLASTVRAFRQTASRRYDISRTVAAMVQLFRECR